MKVKVYKLDPDAKLPTRNKKTDAGLDLYAVEDIFIPVGQTGKVKTGVAVEIPVGYVGRISDRSGMASKGLIVGAGVIDAGYTGDHTVVLHNFNNKDLTSLFMNGWHSYKPETLTGYKVSKGDKIAQLVIYPVETPEVEVVEELWISERGNTGWGSSGS